MRLKDVTLRNAKPRAKPYRLGDGDGLFLLVHPKGGKLWQFRYRFADKENTLSPGPYPEVSLQEAREAREEARKLLRQGKNPGAEKKLAKLRANGDSSNCLKAIAVEWHSKRTAILTPRHATTVLHRLECDLFPDLGAIAIKEIRPLDLLTVLRKIESRGAIESTHRMLQVVGQIFRYAVATGKVERDITADLRGALPPLRRKHFARLSANELPEFLECLNEYDGDRQTKTALKLLVLTFVRTTELRGARWDEFNFSSAEWRIPAERMKMREAHVVPLSAQVLSILKTQQRITGDYEHVFPNRSRPSKFMSENTMLYAIYRMGYHSRATGHGFRSTASTILHENGFASEVIERQLAHQDANSVRAAYNHAEYLPARRELMQWWSDYIETAGMAFGAVTAINRGDPPAEDLRRSSKPRILQRSLAASDSLDLGQTRLVQHHRNDLAMRNRL